MGGCPVQWGPGWRGGWPRTAGGHCQDGGGSWVGRHWPLQSHTTSAIPAMAPTPTVQFTSAPPLGHCPCRPGHHPRCGHRPCRPGHCPHAATSQLQHRGLLAQWYRSMAWTQQFDKCFETLFTFLGSSGTCLGGLWRSPGAGFPNVLNFFVDGPSSVCLNIQMQLSKHAY